ncbi:dCTP deaminase [Candidatus Woesearchaeota archaeon]|nr:dCTP deaminase [Candidatus Woesearchaeota archaeon]
MILTKDKILDEIKKKNIIVTPFSRKNVGPASVDLTLDGKFRLFKKGLDVNVDERKDYKKISSLRKTNELVLEPGDFALGITKEEIKLSENICGWLGGRSRFARLGMLIHSTAAFVQPGVDNRQVLEIKNLSENRLILKAGIKICQMMFERTEGKARYKGKFNKQEL